MRDLMAAMDSELAESRSDDASAASGLSVDMSVVANLLRSVEAEQGLPGPASMLLAALGMERHLPTEDEVD
jgi:hypothetical protein